MGNTETKYTIMREPPLPFEERRSRRPSPCFRKRVTTFSAR